MSSDCRFDDYIVHAASSEKDAIEWAKKFSNILSEGEGWAITCKEVNSNSIGITKEYDKDLNLIIC